MDMLPVKPERKAQLEAYAQLHDQTPAEALDDLLAEKFNAESKQQGEAASRAQLMQRLSSFGKRHNLTLGGGGVKKLLQCQ